MVATHPKTISERSFGLLVGAVLLFWACAPAWHGRAVRGWLVVPAVIFLALGAAVPRFLVWPKRIWLGITTPLGAAIQFLLMAILYSLVITPVGLFFRITGRDALKRQRDPRAVTYWARRQAISDMKQQF